jgi:predicted GIY-YIG superfamily endonuclease
MGLSKEEQREKIRLENESARVYASSIRKTTDKKVNKMNYGYNGKLSFNMVGCYFLWYQNNIVYVGESTCIMSRLVQHQKEGKKVFDRWTFKQVSGSDKQRLSHEKKLIKHYKPKYNKTHKTPVKRKSKSVYLVLSK